MKSKHTIHILIGLMSLALIGVMAIQFLMIKNAIDIKQEQFDKSVNDAMLEVSATMENKIGVQMITRRLETDSAIHRELLQQDPKFLEFMEWASAYDTEHARDSHQLFNDEISVRIRTINKVGTLISDTETEMETAGEPNVVFTANVEMSPEEPGLPCMPIGPPVPPAPPVPATVVKSRLMSIVSNVVDDYTLSKVSVEDLFDSAKISSIIRKEFEKQKIGRNFTFAVLNAEGDTLIINKSADRADFIYQSPLLATDFLNTETMLLVNIPSRTNAILASIWGMLLLSLGFTLCILASFAYSLYVIFKQKKLGEITNDFINNMTHELKTPLATISMTADTLNLQQVSNNPEMVSDYSGRIKTEVQKLSRHVDRILNAAATERNETPVKQEYTNLTQIVLEEAAIFEQLARKQHAVIQTAITSEPLHVMGNADMLRSTISNLLDNALKYSKGNALIKIELKKSGCNILLSVQDNGVGISKSDQKFVFEKFYRAHTGNRHDVKGFGLGLSFAKGVVENLGGNIWVESEPNRGSTFFVTLATA
jgi:two-component system phosphate regulon sensor histidine kinase PhoR